MNWFGEIRDEEERLAVEKLTLEIPMNFRFRGTTMSCSSSTRSQQSRQPDTRTSTRVLQWTSEWLRKMTVTTREKMGTSETSRRRPQTGTSENTQEHQGGYPGGKGGKGAHRGGKNSWQMGSGQKRVTGEEKGCTGDSRTCWTGGQAGHSAAWCQKGGNNNLENH